MYGMRLQRSFISACRELAKLKKETQGEELPELNQILYMQEDRVRMERKLEEMDNAATSNDEESVAGHGLKTRATEASAGQSACKPNEATADAKSWLGQTLPPVKATANPIANAAAMT